MGRKPWGGEPSPRLRHPSPARAGEGTGLREGPLIPTCRDYTLSPRQIGADLFNELLIQDNRVSTPVLHTLVLAPIPALSHLGERVWSFYTSGGAFPAPYPQQ